MSEKVYVVSKLSADVMETKPGAGTYHIKGNSRLLIEDVIASRPVPGRRNETETYVKHTAKEIADSIVQDFKEPGLSVVVEKIEGIKK
jgi:hypothetical protein